MLGESRTVEFVVASIAVQSQTFTMQENTIAVIPLSFGSDDLFVDSSLHVDSASHARYMYMFKNSEWNSYLSAQGGETQFILDKMLQDSCNDQQFCSQQPTQRC